MTIATSNISASSIAAEIGKSQSNMSITDAGRRTVILNPSNSRQSFTLSDSLTLTTQDTAVADNMNLVSGGVEMSEFGGYNHVNQIVFSSTTSSVGNFPETICRDAGSITVNPCGAPVRGSAEIYCKRVGNDIVWYVGEGQFSSVIGTSKKEGTGFSGSDVECARLAGAAANTAATVSVTYSSAHTITGFITGVPGAFSSGSTSSNLVSTNTKIGFDFRINADVETFGNGQAVVFVYHVDFTVTIPDRDPRVFRFSASPMKGQFTSNYQGINQC